MREIKFRVWDVHTNHGMSSPFGIGQGMIYFDDGHTAQPDFVMHELMQFTGLQDNNGVDIYEGDIVYQKINCLADFGRHKKMVGFNEDQFKSGGCSLYEAVRSFDAKVIGNIYENPELLEAE